MRSLALDSLLGERHKHATFHDAQLEELSIDFSTGTAKLKFSIPCGFSPKDELLYQRGTLEFNGLLFYFVEPAAFSPKANDRPGLWITSDGPLPDQEADLAIELPSDLPDKAFAHYFYSSTSNSFIVIAAMQEVFQWE
ncbi:hypothetical protein [Methylibium rhizosphaerae]|uniref:hypothetical protein n=1 Tax=Methylibium rhizosphaerae TaxID=2570323 RepID=UPI0011297C07|nr:hypothetical protein [Methylibium rhizosphaerae]